MIRLCEHVLNTNFAVLSHEAQCVWLYAALRSKDDGFVWIHIRMIPRLAGFSDEQGEKILEELRQHNFYDNDEPPFLDKYEDKKISGAQVLRWKCRYCARFEREFISESIRSEVLAIGLCAHCGSSESLEVDHIEPVTRGGSNERDNLQALCATCNRKKGNRFVG